MNLTGPNKRGARFFPSADLPFPPAMQLIDAIGERF
jgi:hypothetical protein